MDVQSTEAMSKISMAQTLPASVTKSRARKRLIKEWLVEKFLLANSLIAILLIFLIFLFLYREGIKAFWSIPWKSWIGSYTDDFFTSAQVFKYTWQPVSDIPKYSIIPLLTGSLLVALPAVILAGLFGLGLGIYLSEIAGARQRETIKPIMEMLAGIPTVVLGFFMLTIGATLLQNIFHTTFRLNAFVAAVGIGITIIPVIASLAEDSLRTVPREIREASYALGATRWETIMRTVLPSAYSGVLAAVLIGFGRALGETMIVLMASGNAALVTGNIFSSVRTITATIAAEMGEVAKNSEHYYALFFIGAILFTITFLINLLAEILIQRYKDRLKI